MAEIEHYNSIKVQCFQGMPIMQSGYAEYAGRVCRVCSQGMQSMQSGYAKYAVKISGYAGYAEVEPL